MYPKVVTFVALVVLGTPGAIAEDKEVTDEEYSRFPRLFHLDDYDSCLARPGGLYCVGTFYLKPLRDPDPVYELMKEFSEDPHNFNHTLLHRGYCISSRCDRQRANNIDPTTRFQDCAARWGRRRGYRLMLQEVRYCRTHEQKLADESRSLDTPQRLFLAVVCVVILMNAIGTTYDIISKESKKSSLLTAWSMRDNWVHLAGPYSDGDPRLAVILPVEACRVILIMLVTFAHVGIVHNMLYLHNPRHVEQMSHHPVTMLLQNGNSVMQLFIVLSSFWLAHNILHREQLPSFTILPKLVMRRIVRIAPVYLLVLGYAATWWPQLRDGPMWSHTVVAESGVCARKFWSHLLFINNFVDSNEHCLLQTWFIAVDMQLHVFACLITLCLLRIRRFALPILGIGFLVSCGLNWAIAYVNGWKPLFIISVPDNVRTTFSDEPSFREYYLRPHGSLPSMLIGLFVAHLHHEINQRGFKPAEHKWLITSCQMLVPLLPCWTASGYFFRGLRSPLWLTLYVAVDRPINALLSAALLFGAYNRTDRKKINNTLSKSSTKGFRQYDFCWHVWYTLGRSSLSAMMVHWCIAMIFTAATLAPVTTSTFDIMADFLATACCSYLIAVPLTLMVEIPARRFYTALASA